MTEDRDPKAIIHDIREARAKREAQAPKRKRGGGGNGRQPPPPDWQLGTDDKGRVIADLRNACQAIRADPRTAAAFAFDELHQQIALLSQPPIAAGGEPGASPPRLLAPEDVIRLQEWLQSVGIPRLGYEHVLHAIEIVGNERPIHPLRDHLNGLAEDWNGDPRLGSWLHDYLGTPDDEYHRQIGAMFLIAMVKRIYEPGCQSDYMIVLEGPQGEEKSKLCRALAGDAYFSDHLPKIDGDIVRVSAHLRGKWLIEISELSAFSKAEAGALKSFLSRRVEIYIPKYGRSERREPRQCSFIGTTNDDAYLKDDTGGRRFWPVKTQQIDIAGFLMVRDQLLGEAVQAYREGRQHWPDREFEKTVIAPIQNQRQFEDAWTEQIRSHLEILSTVTVAQVAQLIGIAHERLGMMEQKRIASILKKQGWRRSLGGDGRSLWRKPELQTLPDRTDASHY